MVVVGGGAAKGMACIMSTLWLSFLMLRHSYVEQNVFYYFNFWKFWVILLQSSHVTVSKDVWKLIWPLVLVHQLVLFFPWFIDQFFCFLSLSTNILFKVVFWWIYITYLHVCFLRSNSAWWRSRVCTCKVLLQGWISGKIIMQLCDINWLYNCFMKIILLAYCLLEEEEDFA